MNDSIKSCSKEEIMEHDDQIILNLLSAIEEEPNTTQKTLATRLGVAVGVVNSYLKRVIYKGYVKTKSLQRRRLRYLLTPQGIKEKTRLTYEFLEYSYVYIREVRQKSRQALEPFAQKGKNRVVFHGSSEVAELAYLAVFELGMTLVAVIDPDQTGKCCVDQQVQDISWFKQNPGFDILLDLKPKGSKDSHVSEIKKWVGKCKANYVHCFQVESKS